MDQVTGLYPLLCLLGLTLVGNTNAEIYAICDFEQNNMCTLINQVENQEVSPDAGPFDWQIGTGRTDSGSNDGTPTTGPDGAHQGVYYLFVEGSGSRRPGEFADLVTPQILRSVEVCVSFWYSMNGDDVRSLQLFIDRNGQKNFIWQVDGNRGANWIYQQSTYRLNYGDRVGWRAVRGDHFRSDIALDDIIVEDAPCDNDATGDLVTLPFGCDFEREDICSMVQSVYDQFDWDRNSGSTATSLTGPTSAYSGTFYMYIETSNPRMVGDYALLETPRIASEGFACVEFYYHMRGENMGALYINLASRQIDNHVDRFVNDRGDQWLFGQVDVQLQRLDRVQFIGQRGNDIRGDIAIDRIQVRQGRCQGRRLEASKRRGEKRYDLD